MRWESIESLLARARRGDQEALGLLLEKYRDYLRRVGKHDPKLAPRSDLSDVIQQTFLEAQRDFPTFQGQTEPEWIAWLLRILRNNEANAVEHDVLAQKRTIRRDQSMDDSRNDGGALRNLIPGNESSISGKAIRRENQDLVAEALLALPADQMVAIQLRYLESWTLAEIANYFDRRDVAVAGLLKRGLQKLRIVLRE